MRTTIIMLATAACASAATAQISYISQNRYVEARASLATGPQSDAIYAPDFSLFDEEIIRNFSDIKGGAAAHASQYSTLNVNSIIASGTAGGEFGPPAGSSSSTGISHLEVTFMLTQAADYSLNFFANGDLSNYSFTGTSLDLTGFLFPGSTLSESGTLEAGEYTFIFDFGVSGAYGEGNFTFDFNVVPAPATSAVFVAGILATTRRRRTS